MKIVAFGASNHKASINQALALSVAERFASSQGAKVDIEVLDLNEYEMPIYSLDREAQSGVPALAKAFLEKIGSADGLVISFAEYNGTYTSAWKNIFDWMSRAEKNVFQDKPLLALAATPGPRAGAGVLGAFEMSAPHFGAQLVGPVGIGVWGEAYDPATRTLTKAEDVARIDAALAELSGKIANC